MSDVRLPPVLRQFIAFFFVGIIAAIVHFGLLITLKEGYNWQFIPATLVGFVGGAVTSYILNRNHTFKGTQRSHASAFTRFFLVASIGFALTFVLNYGFNSVLNWHYLLAQVLTTIIVMFWNFLANRIWTFNR